MLSERGVGNVRSAHACGIEVRKEKRGTHCGPRFHGAGVKERLQPGSNGPKGPISDLEAAAESCKYTIRGMRVPRKTHRLRRPRSRKAHVVMLKRPSKLDGKPSHSLPGVGGTYDEQTFTPKRIRVCSATKPRVEVGLCKRK